MALVQEARAAGKAICAMKLLGEGYLSDAAYEYIRYGFDLPNVHSVDLGLLSRAQVDMAVRMARGEPVSPELVAAARIGAKREWGENFLTLYP